MALADNLFVYYPLDEASGGTTDSHSGKDLSENVGPIGSTTGKVAGCRDFNGSSQFFAIADDPDFEFGDTDFTIACWVNLDVKTAAQVMIGKFNNTGNQRSYIVLYNNVTDRFEATISANGTATANVVANTFGSPSAGTWYFVVARHNATADTWKISVNAGASDSVSHSGGAFNGTSQFRLGTRGNSALFLDGKLDESAMWKRELSDGEVAELYNSGNGRDYAYITGGGTPTFTGAAAFTLPALSFAGSGTFEAPPISEGSAAFTLPPLEFAGTGTFAVDTATGVGTFTLPALQLAASGTFEQPTFEGAAAFTLPPLQLSGSGTFAVDTSTGQAAFTLPALELSGSGTTEVPTYSGTAAFTLPELQLAGSGTVENEQYTGTFAGTLPALQFTASGTFSETGPVSTALIVCIHNERLVVTRMINDRRIICGVEVEVPDIPEVPGVYTGSAAFTLPALVLSGSGTFVQVPAIYRTFNGTQYFDIADNAALSVGGNVSFTFFGWIWPNNLSGFYGIIEKGNRNEYAAFVAPTTGIVNWAVGQASGAIINLNSSSGLIAGQWNTIELDHDDAANTIGIRVNASARASAAFNATGALDGAGTFELGRLGISSLLHFNGRMASWFLTKRLLTTAERSWLRSAARVHADLGVGGSDGADLLTNLQAYWDLDEAADANALDSQGANVLISRGSPGPGQGVT